MKIVLDGLKKEIAGRTLLDIPSFEFRANKRTVIVGANGCGKTTLFGLLSGQIEPDAGRVVVDKGRLSLLEQDFPQGLAEGSLFDVCADACTHLVQREEELQALEVRFSSLNEAARLRYAELREAFEREGGYDWRREVRLVLEGIGFSRDEILRPVKTFSGGQKRRALLARALVSKPEILLLDEPTNHLDLETIDWLEAWLLARRGTSLIISHDRHLIDAVAEEIVEFQASRLERYPAPFAAFRKERAKRNEARLRQWKEQQEFIEKTEDFIRKNIAGQKTKQAQSRRRLLEKIILLQPPARDNSWKLRFSKTVSEGKTVVASEALRVGYPGAPILDKVSLTLYRGEKVAIVGSNGSGKSTLLKTILGQIKPLAGRVQVDEQARVGYFPQEGGELDPNLSVYDELARERPTASEEELRTLLGAFLFSREEVYKKVAVLSGGEKSRLLLAKLFLRQPNFLIMDEPTNHLDLESRVMLENALFEFEGTILFVSHDRAFIDAIATSLWQIRDTEVLRLEGNIEDNRASLFPPAVTVQDTPPVKNASPDSPTTVDKARAFKRGANRYKIGKIEEAIEDLERRIHEEEAKLLGEDALRDGRIYAGIAEECQRLKLELDERYKEWEEVCG